MSDPVDVLRTARDDLANEVASAEFCDRVRRIITTDGITDNAKPFYLIDVILEELASVPLSDYLAYRGGRRWENSWALQAEFGNEHDLPTWTFDVEQR